VVLQPQVTVQRRIYELDVLLQTQRDRFDFHRSDLTCESLRIQTLTTGLPTLPGFCPLAVFHAYAVAVARRIQSVPPYVGGKPPSHRLLGSSRTNRGFPFPHQPPARD
jgi:hypothetical protein